MAPADPSGRKLSGNRLKHETPFVCNVHFRADLPEISGDPKLLVTPLQPEKLAQFKLTSLEKSSKRTLMLEADLGIPINPLDIERYTVPSDLPELDPEDLALLEDSAGPLTRPTAQERPRAVDQQELSWLMRTSYISNEVKAKRQQQAGQVGQHSDLVADEIQAIEDGFAAAQQPPRHPSKPGLKAVEVLPVLPDFDNWANKYVVVTFDDNPTREHAALAGAGAVTQQGVAAQGLLKPYTVRDDRERQERLVALMLPKQLAPAGDDDEPADEDAEREYEWVREYKFRFEHDPEEEGLVTTCVLALEDGGVVYNRLGSRMALQKRPRGAVTRPSRVTVRKRGLTEEEEQERAAIRQRLAAPDEEGEDAEEAVGAGSRRSSASPSLSD